MLYYNSNKKQRLFSAAPAGEWRPNKTRECLPCQQV